MNVALVKCSEGLLRSPGFLAHDEEEDSADGNQTALEGGHSQDG